MSWLGIVEGPQAAALSAGAALPASASTGAQVAGVRVPESAVLRLEGKSWAFVRNPSGGYDLRELQDITPIEGGLFVGSGVRPGEILVVHGASALHTAEQARG